MRKCGILTWHYLDNYGSFLQAYSIYTIFKQKGLDVKLINYRPGAKTGKINELLRLIKYNLPFKKGKDLRKKKFYDSRKKLFIETKMCASGKELKTLEKFDIYVCGSDQIWASNRFDKTYLFDFTESENKFSYAASTVIDDYSEIEKNQIKTFLPKFKLISVREEKGIEILSKIIDRDILEVLDPTLLINKNDWLMNSNKVPYSDYVLCYLIGDECKYKNIILEFAKRENKKVINICIKESQKFGDVILEDLGPFEFLDFINNCFMFFTDSYHGTLFSINFNIEFYSLKRFEDSENNNQNDRIINILKKLDLMSRFIDKNSVIDGSKIDYKKVNQRLDEYKKKSFEYIDSIIKGI